ncbi:MAG: AAA family ATPase [Bacteroidota bacterium]
MRIKKLEMKNFRGFEKLTIEFPERGSAVFVGINGAGKTSVLECIKSIFDVLLGGDTKFKYPVGHTSNDINIGYSHTENELVFELENENHSITTEAVITSPNRSLWQNKNYSSVELYEHFVEKIYQFPSTNIPLFEFYPTERSANNESTDSMDLAFENQLDAFSFTYLLNFNVFFEWFKTKEDVENEVRLQETSEFRLGELEVVRTALKSFLSDIKDIRVKRIGIIEFIVKKKGEWLSLSMLSHGEKLLVAMIGDIARRLTIANPSLKNPLEGKGIILIDEIELHLHPGWQREIVPRLEQTFPNIQFIFTTHSPQVLSTVDKENIFILEDFKLLDGTPNTLWRDSNSILHDLFRVSKRPEAGKDALNELYKLIDAEEKEKAISKLSQLEENMGEQDAELVRARMFIDMMDE